MNTPSLTQSSSVDKVLANINAMIMNIESKIATGFALLRIP